jgi:hypothetical protein
MASKPKNSGKAWKSEEVNDLRKFVKENSSI